MTRQGGWPSTGFAERLKAHREQAGLSQHQLAERVGCHYITISKLERGTQEPAWPLVRALARALGVSCSAFETEESATPAPPAEPAPPRPRGRPRKERPRKETPAEKPKAKGRKRKGQ